MYHIDTDLVWVRVADVRDEVLETTRLARLLRETWREHLPCTGGVR